MSPKVQTMSGMLRSALVPKTFSHLVDRTPLELSSPAGLSTEPTEFEMPARNSTGFQPISEGLMKTAFLSTLILALSTSAGFIAAPSIANARASGFSGHSFQAHGSIAGHPGASGYAPGRLIRAHGNITGHPGVTCSTPTSPRPRPLGHSKMLPKACSPVARQRGHKMLRYVQERPPRPSWHA